MTAPLIILALLAGPLLICWLLRQTGRIPSLHNVGAWGLALVFLFTASGHFVQTAGLVEMLPPFIPARVPLIYLTGALEIALAIGIAVPATRRIAGLAAIATLVLFFPANVYAAMNHIGTGGHQWGPSYLLIRGPLQAILIAWAWWFTIRRQHRRPT